MMKKSNSLYILFTFIIMLVFISNSAFSKESQFEYEKYESGNIKLKTEKTDDDAIYKSWEYSENGFLTRFVDFFSASCGTSIGNVKNFKGGFLFSKETYGAVLPIDSESKQKQSCDFGYFQSLTRTFYYSTGKVKNTESFKYILANYGDESIPCGTWKSFNSRGKVKTVSTFSSCIKW